MTETGFGIDVGGSSVKAARVDLETGEVIGEMFKVPSPPSAAPAEIATIVRHIVETAMWPGPVGIGLPAVIDDGVVLSAANIDPSWIGTNARTLFEATLKGRGIRVVNDADAVGIAEMTYRQPAEIDGLVIVLTFGTGIGSAILHNGILLPNTELGHLQLNGEKAECRAAASVKDRNKLSIEVWADEVSNVLLHLEMLFNPTVFVVSGGISREHARWIPLLTNRIPVVPALFSDMAGVIGAAISAHNETRVRYHKV